MEIKKIIDCSDYLYEIKEQFEIETEQRSKNIFYSTYLFNKLVSLCTRKGKKKMARKQVVDAFKIVKQFFRLNAIFFIKIAVLQMEPFVFLHKIPRGNKEIIYPRILQTQTRIHNALYLIVKQSFETYSRYYHISLAHTIIDNCMSNNIYNTRVRDAIEVAELNKRNIKYIRKEKGKQILSKIRRYERFKLFKKIKVWK
jgi:ribosomal protein S7